MPIQSIRKTAVPGASYELDRQTYRDEWSELRLKIASVMKPKVYIAGKPAPIQTIPIIMPPAAGKINLAIVDSGVPDGESGAPFANSHTAPAPHSTVHLSQDRDDDGHATNLAATIRGRNGHSAPNLDLRFVKPFSAQGWPKPDRGADAITRAATLGARVIVLAWDAGHTTDKLQKAIFDVRKNAVVVIAAGNWSLDNDEYPNWPANYGGEDKMDHVITVMATDEHDERASYSSYGKSCVYIAAPGFAKLDAAPSSNPLRTAGSLRNSSREFSGTSAATAHVARLAALVLANEPHLTPQQVKQRIGDTGRPVTALEKFCVTGKIVNFTDALTNPAVSTTQT